MIVKEHLLSRFKIARPGIAPEFSKELYLKVRGFSADRRALPNFMVIGAQKSGSTSLFNAISLHPQVIASIEKEPFYFCKNYFRGERWYRRYFPTKKALESIGGITGEGSTTYLTDENAPVRVAKHLPSIRWLAVLRDPATRAISHYFHRRHMQRENRPIDVVFNKHTIDSWKNGEGLQPADAIYFEKGNYYPGLKRWRDAFEDNRGRIVLNDQLLHDYEKTVRSTFEFLGLPKEAEVVRRDFKAGDYAPAQYESLVEQISDAFKERNVLLEREFGLKTGWIK